MLSRRLSMGILWMLLPSIYSIGFAKDYSVDEQLQKFRANSKEFMNDRRNVQKYLVKKNKEIPIDDAPSFLSPESIQNHDFIDYKIELGKTMGHEVLRPGRARIESNDQAKDLVDELTLTKIQDMDGKKKASLSTQPWSGDYWPIYTGELAKRYLDPSFPQSMNWKENTDYIAKAIANVAEINSSSVDYLSPAEKYDLLVGDPNWSLTKAMLADGDKYFVKEGKVETWMGLCHGWSAASFMEKRPKHSIKVTAYDGKTKITFYPSDVKALSTLLWAKASPPTRFIGSRCGTKHPATDGNGRIVNQQCFDTNPGTWHLAVVNQIGVHNRSFVLDATADYEVWNFPVYSYEYTYFNPQTGKSVKRLKDAMVNFSEFKEDKFSDWRNNPNTVSIVGINMKVVYIGETRPTNEKSDSSKKDRTVAVNYLYDLELDQDGNIVGGEWYHNLHPDFLWVPAKDSLARSIADKWLDSHIWVDGEWKADPKGDPSHWRMREHRAIPESWHQIAERSSKQGQPLMRVVKELSQKANQIDLGFMKLNFNRPVY